MNSVEDLDIFKLAHELALKIYSLTKRFPSEEAYSLIDHMRQTAISVGMNLMESATNPVPLDFRHTITLTPTIHDHDIFPKTSVS